MIEIYERLSQINPVVYEPSLAMSLVNLGLLYIVNQRFPEAEVYYLRSIEIYDRLSMKKLLIMKLVILYQLVKKNSVGVKWVIALAVIIVIVVIVILLL